MIRILFIIGTALGIVGWGVAASKPEMGVAFASTENFTVWGLIMFFFILGLREMMENYQDEDREKKKAIMLGVLFALQLATYASAVAASCLFRGVS